MYGSHSMSEEEELQNEEKEVLASIYEGDECFKQISPTTYQYKYGENENQSFVLEITWGPKYPNEKPTFNVDIFHNRNLIQPVKDSIIKAVDEEAEQWLGSAMTYTLFECLKEKTSDLLEAQPLDVAEVVAEVEKVVIEHEQEAPKSEKKEHLTKAQKRRVWDRAELGKGGERPRGYDWVDIVKHLSQVPHNQPVSS